MNCGQKQRKPSWQEVNNGKCWPPFALMITPATSIFTKEWRNMWWFVCPYKDLTVVPWKRSIMSGLKLKLNYRRIKKKLDRTHTSLPILFHPQPTPFAFLASYNPNLLIYFIFLLVYDFFLSFSPGCSCTLKKWRKGERGKDGTEKSCEIYRFRWASSCVLIYFPIMTDLVLRLGVPYSQEFVAHKIQLETRGEIEHLEFFPATFLANVCCFAPDWFIVCLLNMFSNCFTSTD